MNARIVLLMLLPFYTQAQLGSWNILNAKLELNSKWNVFTEAQIRSLKFYDDFHYYELKAGATYQFSTHFRLPQVAAYMILMQPVEILKLPWPTMSLEAGYN